jgi:signal transduction histidine kinase/ActR/RegA family two-component response regulator
VGHSASPDQAWFAHALQSKRGDVDRIGISNGIYAAQIRALYQHTPMVLIVNLVNSALVAIVLASYMGQIRWLIFLGLTIALTAARVIGWACYRDSTDEARSTPKWAVSAIIGSALSGLLWGGSSAFLLPDNLVEQTFVAFVIGGMCAASLVAFSYHFPTFIAYVFPASLPLAGRFFLDGWTVHGDMMVVFAAAMTLAAYHSTRAFTHGLRLNFELTEKTKELTAANRQLETEIAQRKIAEDQLRQVHKMEAIGQLTGGIAHDFNNLLTIVVGRLELAQKRLANDPRTTALVQAAVRAAERGATLTRHLLAFARRQHLDPRAVDVSAVVIGAEKLLHQTIGPEIRLVMHSEPNLPPAWVDPNQLELAILNLALNARDAMPAGGTLRIAARSRRAEPGNMPADLPSGDYVVLSVSDTGIGMEEDVLARAFEPFFTTKEAGRGSGLGLSIVHGFAAQSGGSVQMTSSPGKGTRVDLWLPRAQRQTINCSEIEPEQAITETSGARILVCDDDPDVLAFVGTVLRDGGNTVWEAESPSLALQILKRERPLDLLLVDYAMPSMNGIEVINRARMGQPGLKVLLMSGHADVLHANGALGIPLLAKPFKVTELHRRVAATLYEAALDTGAATPTGLAPLRGETKGMRGEGAAIDISALAHTGERLRERPMQ